MKKTIIPMAIAMLATSCSGTSEEKGEIIDKTGWMPSDRQYTSEVLEAFGRVGAPVVSPDGKVLYSVSFESVEQNKSNADLYVMNIDGTEKTKLTSTPGSESDAVWIENGKRIAFMSPVDGKTQLWVMNADGSNRTAVSNVENGISGFLFSPDGSKVVMIGSVKFSRDAKDIYPDLPDATGKLIDDLMYKHWDEWVTEIPHPLIGDFNGKDITNVKDIMEDEPFESPMKPFGSIESFAWSPDGSKLIYVSRKKTGMEYALSTNSDLYVYDIESGSTSNMTEGMMGYDTAPAYSPDGKYIAWLSMEHDGYESDKNRIFIMNVETSEKTDLTTDWDYTADAIAWAADSKSIYFIAPKDGVTPIFNINLSNKEVKVIADGVFDYQSLAPLADGSLLTMRHSMVQPNEIYSVNNGEIKQLTDVNNAILEAIDMPTVEKRLVPTTDGKLMTTWVVYPPNFDPTKKYPSLLYCQGGPQSAVSQFFSYRWNLALMAANGYIVIAPNRRGVPGFGTEWNAQISGDYGGQNMRDYLSAVDDMKKEAYIDAARIGAVGASYGGFSVYWLAGHHEGRFAAFIAHAGIFNTEAQYLETEEMWFANWDLGGPFWDKSNAIAQNSFANSPHRFVDKWDTPILITHGEYDFRILASQGMMAFNAARLRGVPAEMLIFPDENHWILKPQNSVMWQRVFFRWLDKWLKDEPAKNKN
ncbi:MAG: S9 family peptidase [Barnesiella sp.]|nr:S9 family peptidase [Barnesiella sp.]